MSTETEHLEKYGQLVKQAREISDKATAEKRSLTAEESEKFDRAMEEADAEKAKADELHNAEKRSKRLADALAGLEQSRGRKTDAGQPGVPTDNGRDKQKPHEFEIERRRLDFSNGIAEWRKEVQRHSIAVGTPQWAAHQPAALAEYRNWLATGRLEFRNLQTDVLTQAGYLALPEQMVAGFIQNLDDQVFIRGMARTFSTRAQSLGVLKRTTKLSSAAWGSELTNPTDDTALAYGKRALSPHYQTSSIKISRDLLLSAITSVESIVMGELARDAAELEEQAFIDGHGSGRPLGLFTASSDGISTARDVSTDNTTTAITADGLINALYSLKAQYQARASWLFHRTAIRNIRKLKDGNGQYLWSPGLAGGQPATILDKPYTMSEWVPVTFTTGLYVGIVGDFSWYWIADGLDFGVQVLDQTSARTNQNEYIARRKVDGMPMLEEAFARVKLA